MPELPEVETIRLGLKKYLTGHLIKSIKVLLKKQLDGEPKDIVGAKIIDVKRFGKGLIINLANNYSLAIHVKMTGQLIYRDDNITNNNKDVFVPNKFTHIIFSLDKNAKLYYNDVRQFGWIKILPTDQVLNLPFFKKLGPEFIKNLNLKIFNNILLKHKTSIKILIMDQNKMTGLGNIYANDSLYLAKINPKAPANSLSKSEGTNLFNSIENVLKKGIKEGGSSEVNFVNAEGLKGNYQNYTLIYGKNGHKCKICNSIILKITLGGRGTYYCPICQK